MWGLGARGPRARRCARVSSAFFRLPPPAVSSSGGFLTRKICPTRKPSELEVVRGCCPLLRASEDRTGVHFAGDWGGLHRKKIDGRTRTVPLRAAVKVSSKNNGHGVGKVYLEHFFCSLEPGRLRLADPRRSSAPSITLWSFNALCRDCRRARPAPWLDCSLPNVVAPEDRPTAPSWAAWSCRRQRPTDMQSTKEKVLKAEAVR